VYVTECVNFFFIISNFFSSLVLFVVGNQFTNLLHVYVNTLCLSDHDLIQICVQGGSEKLYKV